MRVGQKSLDQDCYENKEFERTHTLGNETIILANALTYSHAKRAILARPSHT